MARGKGHLEWESSKAQKAAETWWTEHGFEWKLIKRFISKSEYEISKDGYTMNYEVPNIASTENNQFMEGASGFAQSWKIFIEVQQMRKEAKAKGII